MRLPAPRLCFLFAAASLSAVSIAPSVALAQDAFPAKPIQLVLPFPPGGATDVVGRIVAQSSANGSARRLWWTTLPVRAPS